MIRSQKEIDGESVVFAPSEVAATLDPHDGYDSTDASASSKHLNSTRTSKFKKSKGKGKGKRKLQAAIGTSSQVTSARKRARKHMEQLAKDVDRTSSVSEDEQVVEAELIPHSQSSPKMSPSVATTFEPERALKIVLPTHGYAQRYASAASSEIDEIRSSVDGDRIWASEIETAHLGEMRIDSTHPAKIAQWTPLTEDDEHCDSAESSVLQGTIPPCHEMTGGITPESVSFVLRDEAAIDVRFTTRIREHRARRTRKKYSEKKTSPAMSQEDREEAEVLQMLTSTVRMSKAPKLGKAKL